MNESEKQFSFTRAASSTGGRAKSKFLSVKTLAAVVIAVTDFGLRAQALATATLISAPPPDACNFYSLQFTNLPPLPFDPFPELPLYYMGDGIYVVDDTTADYARLRAEAEMNAALSSAEAMTAHTGPMWPQFNYSAEDLWLEITAFTNNTAALVIHRPESDTSLSHDLYYATNLAAPIQWSFVMRCVYTNVLVPNLCSPQGFFRLGPDTNGVLTVTSNATPQQLAEMLVPPWITVTNATYTGAAETRGMFSGGNGCGLPIESGVILSSGYITYAVGPNDEHGASIPFFTDGDPDLDNLVGGSGTHDAAVLEFDIAPTNSFILQFEYVFASEEYPEFIGIYNDPLGIFVTTNRVGANWVNTLSNDVALVPGTQIPVSVNSINGGCGDRSYNPADPANPQYYVDNHDPSYPAMSPYAVSAPVYNLQYDGLTVLLTARAQIAANVTNHVKIAIADCPDWGVDSAVFIKAWSAGSCCQCQ
jgi:hypothetical protein